MGEFCSATFSMRRVKRALEVHALRSRWLRHLGGIGRTGSRLKGGAYTIDRPGAGDNRVSATALPLISAGSEPPLRATLA